mgnify:CR=1 FL=1
MTVSTNLIHHLTKQNKSFLIITIHTAISNLNLSSKSDVFGKNEKNKTGSIILMDLSKIDLMKRASGHQTKILINFFHSYSTTHKGCVVCFSFFTRSIHSNSSSSSSLNGNFYSHFFHSLKIRLLNH